MPATSPARPSRGTIARVMCAGSIAVACGADAAHHVDAVDDVRQAIQGGYVDDATSGVVGLGIFEEDHFFTGHCSGTLIAPNLVLTARHCVTQISLREDAEVVECGVTDFERTRIADSLIVSPETERPLNPLDPSYVRGSSVHPAPNANDVCGFDVALLILDRNLEPFEAAPIVPRIDRQTVSREPFSASGYGLTEDDESASSGMRMRVDDNEVLCSTSECQNFYPELVTDTEWLSADAGVCSGDSGGPALDAEGKVIGVASRGGEECMATIYGDVAAWGDFIIEIALRAAEEGDYPPLFWTSGSSDAPEVVGPNAISPTGDDDETNTDDDETNADEPNDDEPEVSDHGDLECESENCGGQFAAESGCSVATSPRRALPSGFGFAALVGWVLAGWMRRVRGRGRGV